MCRRGRRGTWTLRNLHLSVRVPRAGTLHIVFREVKIHFIVVGKTTDKRLAALVDEYAARVKHYVPFGMEVVPELKNTKSLTVAQQKAREGELLRKSLREGDHVVLLDEGGREFRSVDFAAWLDSRQSVAARRLVFIVGGPYGFSDEIRALAKEKVSLSRMTLSHQMVRLFFVEQCYRAMTIRRGEPYHHE